MKENGKTQCTRCRMGVPIGITIALIGLAGIIISAKNYESTGFLTMTPYIALFLIGPPFARMATLVNGAHRRIDNLERSLN